MTSTRIPAATTPAPTPPAEPQSWSVEDAKELYNIEGWGAGFFDINDAGHVIVRPDPSVPGTTLDLFEIAVDLEAQGVPLPVLLRFSDILKRRIETLSESFATAIREFEYTGGYTTVYPIKVNQQRHVVEEIVEFGRKHGVGLECGSKPELQAVLGLSESTEHIIVCNGYKDEEFMRLALMGQKLGHNVFIVMEQLSELDVLLDAARDLGVTPRAGVRIKLASEGAGRWAQSGGEKSKFGLNTAELMKLIDRLKEMGQLDILRLVHFHLGSQITDIRFIKAGLQEISRYYAELHKLGVNITHVDVGGGLGVDYDGSGATDSSINYNEQEYANDVVSIIQSVCDERGTPHPNIVTECVPALVAHHSVLFFNVLGINEVQKREPSVTTSKDDHRVIQDLVYIMEQLNENNLHEYYHDVLHIKETILQLFTFGVLSLQSRAKAENLCWVILTRMEKIARANPDSEDIANSLRETLSDTYFCNFSVFQSMPDSWAVGQLFTVLLIYRIHEEPNRRAIFVDLTCD